MWNVLWFSKAFFVCFLIFFIETRTREIEIQCIRTIMENMNTHAVGHFFDLI